jgi:hypothetical protein
VPILDRRIRNALGRRDQGCDATRARRTDPARGRGRSCRRRLPAASDALPPRTPTASGSTDPIEPPLDA